MRGVVLLENKAHEKNGQGILLFIGWVSAFLPYILSPVVFGPLAVLIGIVLKRDYEVGDQSKWIMILGAVNTVGGFAFAYWVISNLEANISLM